jgi:hypothetical protein
VNTVTTVKSQPALRHPLAHPVEMMCTRAIGAGGQLLLSRWLARAAESAERADLRPGVVIPTA